MGSKYKFDFVITEIGGTVGDIESLPYLESIRQLKWEMGRNALCVHLTYVPYLAAAGELKTKPTQHSVKELQSVGIQPDVLVLRTEHELSTNLKKKVALFCNVDENAAVSYTHLRTALLGFSPYSKFTCSKAPPLVSTRAKHPISTIRGAILAN